MAETETRTPLEMVYAHPEQWYANEYHFIHRPTGFAVWISDGPGHCAPMKGGQYTGREKRRFWKAYRWWRAHAPITSYADI